MPISEPSAPSACPTGASAGTSPATPALSPVNRSIRPFCTAGCASAAAMPDRSAPIVSPASGRTVVSGVRQGEEQILDRRAGRGRR